jgi:hypothetical protein
MIRRNFITGAWETVDETDMTGTYVLRDGKLKKVGTDGVRVRNEKSSRRTICSKHPWVSKSCGVHPRRVDYVNKKAVRMGMDFQVNKKGFATATSAKGKKDAMRYFGMHNNDGGYGDICP